MIRKLTKAKKERRRKVNGEAVMKIYERAKQGKPENVPMVRLPHETRPPASGDLSFQRVGSRVAGVYVPAKSGKFRDSRGRLYESIGGTVYRVAEG